MSTRRAMTVLSITDFARTEPFYRDMGFDLLGAWGEPTGAAIFQRGDVTMMLQKRDEIADPLKRWAAYIYVDDVDAVYEEFVARNLPVTEPPEDKDYGCRDFGVVDPDGYVLVFGTDHNEEPYGMGLGPNRGRG